MRRQEVLVLLAIGEMVGEPLLVRSSRDFNVWMSDLTGVVDDVEDGLVPGVELGLV